MHTEEQQRQVRASKEYVRTLIARAELPAGVRLDEADLRKDAGATVRAMRAALCELAREGVLTRRRHSGTFVAEHLPAAQSLAPPKLRSVGILSSRAQGAFADDIFCMTVLKGVQLALHQPAQITFFVHARTNMSVDDLPVLDLDFLRRTCQGVVAIEAYNAGQLNELARSLPLAVVDFAPQSAAFESVEIDHFRAGYQAARHLHALGHRRVAFVGEGAAADSTDPTWQQRLNGYLRATLEAGLPLGPEWILNVRRDVSAVQSALPEFQRRLQPSAYVLCTGSMAGGAMAALQEMGLRVPADVSLSAADSSMYQSEGQVISQVRADYEMLGRQAVRLLAARLTAKFMPPVRVLLPVTFQPGQTSASAK